MDKTARANKTKELRTKEVIKWKIARVVHLNEGDRYCPNGYDDQIHGMTDGTHGP